MTDEKSGSSATPGIVKQKRRRAPKPPSKLPRFIVDGLKRRHGTRTATLATCRRCGVEVIAGLDADDCAFSAAVDVEPVTPIGEAIALLGGRASYDFRPHRTGFTLTRRSASTIRRGRDPRADVLVEHRCTAGDLPRIESNLRPPTAKRSTDDDRPPF